MLAAIFISLLSILSIEVRDTLLQPATVVALKETVTPDRIPSPFSEFRCNSLKTNGTYRPNLLSGQVPGLHIPEYGASLTSTIYLRGLGSRMENPVMGLYIDGIPVLDKNAYDFDWVGIRSAVVLRGPQGTLYGRNAMGGVLSLQSFGPGDAAGTNLYLEYGTASTLRAGAVVPIGNSVFSATFRHTDGYFPNEYKGRNCDPYDGISAHWKWEGRRGDRLRFCNTLWMSLTREGGFAYGPWKEGKLLPISYNDEATYRRISMIEGINAEWRGDEYMADAAASIQLLEDDMRMDQDYSPESVFTLQQRQLSGAGTLEIRLRRSDRSASWQPQTGIFALYKLNGMAAPVTFKQDGIRRLILDNANNHIPSEIGYLDIPDEQFPVNSRFLTGTWNLALFHQAVFTLDKWQFTAGFRLDWEGSRMDYDCLASFHYRFVPTMKADKPFDVPYRGSKRHAVVQILPRLSVLYAATDALSLYSTISKGYRAGGFNTQIFSDILQNETMNALMKDLGVYLDRPIVSVTADNTEYDPETAWNFELGSRLKRGNLRVELSAYHIAVRNQQLTVFPPGMSTGRMMTNAGRSRNTGIEAELDWTPGNFRSHAAWSWCDARFVRYDDGTRDYSGKHIPYVPGHTLYLGAGYSLEMDGCRLEADMAAKGVGPIWWNEENSLREVFRLSLEGRMALAFPKWELYVQGTNLTNTGGRTFYFKTVGNEFFARLKPRIILTGISIQL